MQFRNPKSKNFKKLKEITRNERCYICHHSMMNTGVFVWSVKLKDCTRIKCINCLTIYGTDFNIKTMGIPMGEVGSA